MTEFEEMVAEDAFAWALQAGVNHKSENLYELFWEEKLSGEYKYELQSDSEPMTDWDYQDGEQPYV